MKLRQIKNFLSNVQIDTVHVLGSYYGIVVNHDAKALPLMHNDTRCYLQVEYGDIKPDGNYSRMYGQKYYLSEHMTETEIVNLVFQAYRNLFEQKLKENFRVNSMAIFSPKIDYKSLVTVAGKDHITSRKPIKVKKSGKRKTNSALLQRRKQRQSIPPGIRKK